jgi:probable HAF family extracellular repeat protein
VDLGSLGPIRSGFATAINEHKQIVGSSAAADNPDFPFQTDLHAFLWENGVMKDLGTLGGRESNAQAINDRGQVVGISAVSMSGQSEQHAFLWENGVMKDLGAGLDGRSDARSINNRGQVVGAADALAGGFLYEPGKGVRALNDLVNPADGLNIVYPQSINDRREIVGYGCKGALCGPILLVRVSEDKETGAGTDAAEEGAAPEPGR